MESGCSRRSIDHGIRRQHSNTPKSLVKWGVFAARMAAECQSERGIVSGCRACRQRLEFLRFDRRVKFGCFSKRVRGVSKRNSSPRWSRTVFLLLRSGCTMYSGNLNASCSPDRPWLGGP